VLKLREILNPLQAENMRWVNRIWNQLIHNPNLKLTNLINAPIWLYIYNFFVKLSNVLSHYSKQSLQPKYELQFLIIIII